MSADRLRYRGVGRSGDRYPDWVAALRGRSGVYVIRDADDREALYVGESHSGRLYETLTRHFQRWSGPTSGPTFNRADVVVAVRVTRAQDAVEEQNALICRLGPRRNRQSDCDDFDFSGFADAPF